MLVTDSDPRAVWHAIAGCVTDDCAARLRALPTGARVAPLEWVCTTRVERRGHFDKDEQGEVFYDYSIATGWRAEPDPRVHQAGALSFHGVHETAAGVLSRFPGPDQIGGSITALTLEGDQLDPTALASIGRTRAWVDLSIWGARWSPPARAAGVRELATGFPGLLGLELHTAALDPDDLAVLAGAEFVDKLEDLTLTGSALDPRGACMLAERLGRLRHLDLRDSRLGLAPIQMLARKLGHARRLALSNTAIGDAGVRALLEAHALDHVEDLWLSGCGLTDASAHALAEASPPRLRGLWIDANQITDDGIAALVEAPLFARLTGTSLYQRGLTERTRGLLAGHALAGGLLGTTRLPGVGAWWFLGR